MVERPRTHNQEAAEKTGNRYLANLGLEWTELRGKQVLDIGAMNAEFENAACRRGVDVISVDKEVVDGEYMPPIDSRFVIAHATKLPFKDGSFDYALAHMSAMNYKEPTYKDEEQVLYIQNVLHEACRALKPYGQFRFTDTSMGDDDLRNGDDDVIPDRKSDSYEKWRMTREARVLEEMAKRAGFSTLMSMKYPDTHPEKAEYRLTHYYIATKGGFNQS